MSKHILTIAVLILCRLHSVHAQPVPLDTISPRVDRLYAGLRIGIPFLVGIRAHYVGGNDDESSFYVDVDASTVFMINSLSIGGGVYALGNVLYVGAKCHWFSESRARFINLGDYGFSAEIGASIPLAKKRSWLFTIDAGPIVIPHPYYRIAPCITAGFVGSLP